MITDNDILKIIRAQEKVFATKEDLKIEILPVKEDIKDLKQDITGLRESVQSLIISIDKLAKAMEIYHHEQVALIAKVDRHEKWIQQIAEKVGIELKI